MSDETKATNDAVVAALQRRAEEIAALPPEERDDLRALYRQIEIERVTQKGTLPPEKIELYLDIIEGMTEALVEIIDAGGTAGKA